MIAHIMTCSSVLHILEKRQNELSTIGVSRADS
jgi:hypothetical protein